MEKLRSRKSFLCALVLSIILCFSIVIPISVVETKAETVQTENSTSVETIIANSTFITFRKGDENSQYGRNIFLCYYVPNSVYESTYSYGVVIFPKLYGDRYDLKSDYLNKAEEQGILIMDVAAPAGLPAPDGMVYKCGIARILDQNVNLEFTFVFYAKDTEGNIAYAQPKFATYSTLDAEDLTDAQLLEILEHRATMDISFRTIVNKLSELVNSFWIYIVLAMGTTVVVWSSYLGIRIAVAKRKEEQVNARGMVKNLVIGIIVMFTIAMAVPLLINGLSWWATW